VLAELALVGPALGDWVMVELGGEEAAEPGAADLGVGELGAGEPGVGVLGAGELGAGELVGGVLNGDGLSEGTSGYTTEGTGV
jgi:hypothetical protein